MKARYFENNSRWDSIKFFRVRERAVAFAREVCGYIAAELDNDDVVLYEVRYLKSRAL